MDYPHQAVDSHTVLFWFRRDLRLEDNTGLYHALSENKKVLGLFIFDNHILSTLDDNTDPRVNFIYQTVTTLKKELENIGTSLLVMHGNPISIFQKLSPLAVYANEDYEPYARKRDQKIDHVLAQRGIPLLLFKDQVIFAKDEITKNDGSPYSVFTPYKKKWKEKFNMEAINPRQITPHLQNLKKISPLYLIPLSKIGFNPSSIMAPPRIIKTETIHNYHHTRDIPALDGTSKLSVHLRFGTISIRKLVGIAYESNEVWLNELIWREFYMMILWHFPDVVNHAFKPAYDRITWRNNEQEFQAWCEGKTGYPLVDAGMRELNQTGYMHNRVRMVTASFLTKHLLIDWRWGEAYFAKKLLDFDLAANNGGWQWAAGSGCDAAPYFRVFNPMLQAAKFDPDHRYINKWISEWGTGEYPRPIVEHALARKRALDTYKKALQK